MSIEPDLLDDFSLDEDEYLRDENCPHCKRSTSHACFDAGHERDSSGDYQRCLRCGATLYGFATTYSNPRRKT